MIKTDTKLYLKSPPDVTTQLNFGVLEEFNVVNRLDGLYRSFTGNSAYNQKSSIIIWDKYEDLVTEDLVDNIQKQLVNCHEYSFLHKKIMERFRKQNFYQQSIVLFYIGC